MIDRFRLIEQDAMLYYVQMGKLNEKVNWCVLDERDNSSARNFMNNFAIYMALRRVLIASLARKGEGRRYVDVTLISHQRQFIQSKGIFTYVN